MNKISQTIRIETSFAEGIQGASLKDKTEKGKANLTILLNYYKMTKDVS